MYYTMQLKVYMNGKYGTMEGRCLFDWSQLQAYMGSILKA
jgi:hypothetical protein